MDYVKSLGVDGFWINPFFESPFNADWSGSADIMALLQEANANETVITATQYIFFILASPTISLSYCYIKLFLPEALWMPQIVANF